MSQPTGQESGIQAGVITLQFINPATGEVVKQVTSEPAPSAEES